MNNQDWIDNFQWNEVGGLSPDLGSEEVVYTLYIRDFLQMPDVDYRELASWDMEIRALLN